MNFIPINLQNWPRFQTFYYFSKMAPTGYSVTVNLDVSRLLETIRNTEIRFFPAYLWLVTKNLNAQTEFKLAERDGILGYYDRLTPLYAHFHEDDHTFSLIWTKYTENFLDFHRAYICNQEAFGGTHGILSQPQAPPANAYTISCIPWISFTHFAVHSYENKPYYFPSVEAGKFFEQNGSTLMPLSITCHHAATDGYHIKCFLDALQDDMDHFAAYIK